MPNPSQLAILMSPPKYLNTDKNISMKGARQHNIQPGVEPGQGETVAEAVHGRVGAGSAAHVAASQLGTACWHGTVESLG